MSTINPSIIKSRDEEYEAADVSFVAEELAHARYGDGKPRPIPALIPKRENADRQPTLPPLAVTHRRLMEALEHGDDDEY